MVLRFNKYNNLVKSKLSTFVPYERRWSWYRMTHCKVKDTGRGIVWHIAMWNTLVVVSYDILPCEIHWLCNRAVPQPMYFTWHYVIQYHNKCISPCNVLCGTTTNVFHLVMCYAVYRMAPFHIAPVVLPYDTLPGERHWSWYCMTHCHVKGYAVPQQVPFTWKCVMRYHNQCISAGNVLCGTTTYVFHLAMCYAVPEPVYFTWQCAMRHHNQCISAGNVLCGTVLARPITVWHIARWEALTVVP
jgi:hypothetical protein